jgi:hypothetical protein
LDEEPCQHVDTETPPSHGKAFLQSSIARDLRPKDVWKIEICVDINIINIISCNTLNEAFYSKQLVPFSEDSVEHFNRRSFHVCAGFPHSQQMPISNLLVSHFHGPIGRGQAGARNPTLPSVF